MAWSNQSESKWRKTRGDNYEAKIVHSDTTIRMNLIRVMKNTDDAIMSLNLTLTSIAQGKWYKNVLCDTFQMIAINSNTVGTRTEGKCAMTNSRGASSIHKNSAPGQSILNDWIAIVMYL